MAAKFSCAENPRRIPAEATNEKDGMKEDSNKVSAQIFTFHELAAATKNFGQECLLSETGIGRVYKGLLEKTGQVVKHFRLLHILAVQITSYIKPKCPILSMFYLEFSCLLSIISDRRCEAT